MTDMPSTPTLAELTDLVAELAGARLGPDTQFFVGGLTSADLVAVHHALLARYSVDIAVTALFKYPTLRAVVRYVTTHGDDAHPESHPPATVMTADPTDRRRLRTRIQQLNR